MLYKEENITQNKSFDFAVRIVNLFKHLSNDKKEFVLSKQVLRSGTSIGANISEAIQGQSKKDFLSKMNIAWKEANETEYWLRLLKATGYLSENEYKSIYKDCIELEKLLISIVKTSKKDNKRAVDNDRQGW